MGNGGKGLEDLDLINLGSHRHCLPDHVYVEHHFQRSGQPCNAPLDTAERTVGDAYQASRRQRLGGFKRRIGTQRAPHHYQITQHTAREFRLKNTHQQIGLEQRETPVGVTRAKT